MESPPENVSKPVVPPDTAESRTLQFDFTWRKFKGLISEVNDPEAKPLYIVSWHAFKRPQMRFKSPTTAAAPAAAVTTTDDDDDEDAAYMGSGTFHNFSINADYEVRGRSGTLTAQKRFKTVYTYPSYAFSDTDQAVTMTWTSSSGFKTWDFVCMDEQQMPVARFSANVWGLKKLGLIDFMGPHAMSDAVRDEIVVTGLTLFYCMVLRSSSITSFFAAAFSQPSR
ncbi:hypothetical protein ASPZODRAFT_15532 [Penicilliopsis zonata CBS 506.65]|uniref:Uncharacterized protein n=1 Tax=Penicilliopsis zonata CBS 506.65 TaxID=1073090 RepID=A0A1L9SI27_9EURO|nr:hypothetical protein ASPZODRAFT_15532 [Penicilliopsis zonata CBS 506.65]OJJ46838.1 hypothetical protein ASPZODRAFT_15532 [Penicilliopsis zonata CBS 506.65]